MASSPTTYNFECARLFHLQTNLLAQLTHLSIFPHILVAYFIPLQQVLKEEANRLQIQSKSYIGKLRAYCILGRLSRAP